VLFSSGNLSSGGIEEALFLHGTASFFLPQRFISLLFSRYLAVLVAQIRSPPPPPDIEEGPSSSRHSLFLLKSQGSSVPDFFLRFNPLSPGPAFSPPAGKDGGLSHGHEGSLSCQGDFALPRVGSPSLLSTSISPAQLNEEDAPRGSLCFFGLLLMSH